MVIVKITIESFFFICYLIEIAKLWIITSRSNTYSVNKKYGAFFNLIFPSKKINACNLCNLAKFRSIKNPHQKTDAGLDIVSWPISRVLSWTVIHLGHVSPHASSNLPESNAGRANGFLFGLAPSGVYLATDCYQLRGALLPHPFTLTGSGLQCTLSLGGLLSVALSVGSRPPGVTWHSALWSPDFPPPRTLSASGRYASSDCLANSGAHTTHLAPKAQGFCH